MRDFTFNIYIDFIKRLIREKYQFQKFSEFVVIPFDNVFFLRNDIDLKKNQALFFAKLEKDLDVKATYYFRIVKTIFDPKIIKQVSNMGHEIGYHYEDVDLVLRRQRTKDIPKKNLNFSVQKSGLNLPGFKKSVNEMGEIVEEWLIDLAYESFCKNLEKFREIYSVKTICMHGSPLSPFDNKIIWEKYDYRKLGIIGEPYFDIDFNEVFYLTDTGRRWDGEKVSVRDKVKSKKEKINSSFEHLRFRHTKDIIRAAEEGRLPEKMMITIHPQRWHDSLGPWLKELLWQKTKNFVKKYYYVKRSN